MPIGRIQREARGLLAFLDIVGQTERPTALEDFVRGTVDLTAFYGAGLLSSDGVNATAQNIGDKWTYRVPERTAVYLIGADARVIPAVGEDAQVSIGIETKSGGFVRMATSRGVAASTPSANARIECPIQFSHPIVLTAGEGLSGVLDDSTLAAARTAGLNLVGLFYTT